MQPFTGMELKVLPHALAWMANNMDSVTDKTSGNSWLYQFVRATPALFVYNGKVKKKKRK